MLSVRAKSQGKLAERGKRAGRKSARQNGEDRGWRKTHSGVEERKEPGPGSQKTGSWNFEGTR